MPAKITVTGRGIRGIKDDYISEGKLDTVALLEAMTLLDERLCYVEDAIDELYEMVEELYEEEPKK